ncbi:MAG TPA: hypothetical protein P5277_01300 [Candidatus Paceibacterota bacterium]|nr:hypothetical protein [Candidatus Paceibacterota bacterium]
MDKKVTNQELVLDYLWNYTEREHEIKDISRNTHLKIKQVHTAVRALKNRGVVSIKKDTLRVNGMPKNLLKIKTRNLNKIKYIINKMK